MTSVGNIEKAIIDDDSLDLLITAFKLYDIAKMDNNVYRKDEDLKIIRHLITLYYKLVNPNYNNMIYNFRRRYISNELLVEKNDSPYERRGLNLVYDYIQNFDIDHDPFNIFITSLQIHSLLYKPLDEKVAADVDAARKRAKEIIAAGRAKAKETGIFDFYKQAQKEAENIINGIKGEVFGGQLRSGSVVMHDFSVEVPDANVARDIFNSYLSPEKKEEFEKALNNADIFSYIDYAVNTTCDLIGIQPFTDGNKRVFRSLLNLMFKEKGLPPVYVTSRERKAYHEALEKALVEHDYRDIDAFYYYKICDSIYELDFKPFLESIGKTQESIITK